MKIWRRKKKKKQTTETAFWAMEWTDGPIWSAF